MIARGPLRPSVADLRPVGLLPAWDTTSHNTCVIRTLGFRGSGPAADLQRDHPHPV